ncbi:hypothetical protein C8P63_1451, partial [Melghirimyces profundicolus]
REATPARLVLCECIARPGREATPARLVLCECNRSGFGWMPPLTFSQYFYCML